MSKEGIANALRAFRMRSGKSAEEVAAIVGKSKKTIWAWETCNGQPDADTLLLLFSIYGVKSFEEFKMVADDEEGRVVEEERIWGQPILTAYQKADESTQRAVCAVLRIGHVQSPSIADTYETIAAHSDGIPEDEVQGEVEAALRKFEGKK